MVLALALPRRHLLDGAVVGDQRDGARPGDPVEEPLVAAVETGAGIGRQHRRIRLLLHVEQHPVVAGAEADEVAFLDLDLVGFHDTHEPVVADKALAAAAMGFEVDHDAAALHRVRRQVLDAERHRADMLAALDRAAVAVVDRPDDVLAGAVAVVEHDLRLAVAVGVEQLPDMREAVPLRRVLQRHLDDVVADHVDELRVLARQRIGDVGHAVALVGDQPWRVAARVDDGAAGVVERQAEAEGAALPHLGDALQHLVRGQQVEPAELVVGAPVAPGRAGRAALPARMVGHVSAPLPGFQTLPPSTGWPSARQRSMPPVRLATLAKPACCRMTVACAERLPARQTATIGRARSSSPARSASWSSGISTASLMWPSGPTNSSGSRTSRICTFAACSSRPSGSISHTPAKL